MLRYSLAAATIVVLSACAQISPTQTAAQSVPTPSIPPYLNVQGQVPSKHQSLTLEKIMADPKWIGHAPYISHWRWDSQAVYFDQKADGAPYPQRVELKLDGSQQAVEIAARYKTDMEEGVDSENQTRRAYIYRGNLFLADLNSGKITQLTRNSEHVSQPMFLADGRIAYRQDNQFFAIDSQSGLTEQLADIRTEDSPKPPANSNTFLATEQRNLINWIAETQNKAKKQHDVKQKWQSLDASATRDAIYLGKAHKLIAAKLSASGHYLMLAYSEARKERADSDIMPNYITHDGTIETKKVRQRVADADPAPLKLMLVDVRTNEQTILDTSTLPGIEEDVFKSVREANIKAYGDRYKVPEVQKRKLQLIEDWGLGESSLKWHAHRDIIAIMVEATDNKDRWIFTVDTSDKIAKVMPQHRLHDAAWVGYDFNSFGWANDALYYLSEESGYSNLYLKTLNQPARRLVGGKQEVQSLTLSADAAYIYYTSNPSHPGIYDVFRVVTKTGSIEQLTDLKGMTGYKLSPDESKLMLTHSTITKPAELWLVKSDGSNQPKQLTDSTSQEFKTIEWQTPDIIAMPSPSSQEPIYAKMFYPNDYDPKRAESYPAVMFIHGAGYLQNVHFGWSAYFREFMFHNLLAEHGYVVMDIDYRASQGYGRDFRTAIYRNMGHPEVEDMALGVDWMVSNANVNRKRVGVYGGSYGGFLTFMALFTQPDLFAAGAALRPVTDWAHYNAPYTSNILNTPQIDPQAYRISSPIYHAEGLSKPLLINAPMLDDNVFFQDTVRLVQRLIELEKDDFETAIFPVEPHGFKEPSSWLDEYKRIFKLFENHLKK